MKIEYQVEYEEYAAASRAAIKGSVLHRRQRFWVWIWTGIVGAGAALFGFLNTSGTPASPSRRPNPSLLLDVLLPLLPWLAVFVVVWILVYALRRNHFRKAFDVQPMAHRRTTMELIDGGIAFTTDVSRTELKWEAFRRFAETSNAFVLFVSDMGINIVPKRAFPDAQTIDGFRDLLTSRIGSAGSAFQVIEKSLVVS